MPFGEHLIGSHLKQATDAPLINLASQEYFKAVPQKELVNEIISPVFKDEKNGTLKIISFYAKKARGLMARYLIQNRITKHKDLLAFNLNGYRYDKTLSTPTEPVFIRPASTHWYTQYWEIFMQIWKPFKRLFQMQNNKA